jgi:nucleoside-diphosphate-sugar epimerase
VAGLQYNIKVWRDQWPKIMRNVINACKENGSKLVFFDNVYLYGRVEGWMTEETPANPSSKKGEVRAGIARMLMEESKAGNLQALIARSADFYGPDSPLSFVNVMVFENLRKNKTPQWMVDADKRHSFTFTPDAGKATALLGNTDWAYNQVWHVPTDHDVLTGREFTRLAAVEFGKDPGKLMVVSKIMLQMLGLFIPVLNESIEMLYQNRYDYLFDSSKFQKAFNQPLIRYPEGVKITAESMKIANSG